MNTPLPSPALHVDLGDRSYPIYIGSALLQNAGLLQAAVPGRQVLVVSNAQIAKHYAAHLTDALSDRETHTVLLPEGEQHKTLAAIDSIVDALIERAFDRECTLVALGGGVVGDITGFAAASYQRGVHFVQVPTSLLAQVDSSVGGKTGVNHSRGKNMIGAFHQPQSVLIDLSTLDTLSTREFRAGMAEVIKYGLALDADFLDWIEANMAALLAREHGALEYAVATSCAIKARVVAADEREAGQRALLNLGHTFGHAIETHTGYSSWLHGEAIATGMCLAARLAEREGLIDCALRLRTEALFEQAELPTEPPHNLDAETLLELMARDKKARAGQIRLVLPVGVGKSVTTSEYSRKNIVQLIDKT
ncbi:MAG: 3-dehydroquinate synthase [Pseudomonadota bacterium]